jgi:hypothetical protein
MGASGTGSFENDDALNWVDAFCASPDIGAVRTALEAVVGPVPGKSLTTVECGAAIAAAEVVAALRGSPSADLPEELAGWIAENRGRVRVTKALIRSARRALKRISSDSDMNESWVDEPTRREWRGKLGELEARLVRHDT